MKAGDLNRLVRIERRVDGEDAAGQPLQTWEPVASVWASVRAPKGMGYSAWSRKNLIAFGWVST